MAGLRNGVGMFREISVLPVSSLKWKSITICTGASASTLQDIKVPESCGGFSYIDSGTGGSSVRNRFIYWRSHQDVLEMVEESLDSTLSGNLVRYRFQDTPVLPNVSIHETHGSVVVLVATVASVHRLVFPHPRKLQGQPSYALSEQNSPSIFYSATLPDDPKNQFLLTPGGSITSHFLSGASCVCLDGHALFSLATTTGGILLVKMPPLGVSGVVIQQELSCASVMKKLWNGLVPGVMRSGQQICETVTSVQLVPVNDDIYIVCVCRDVKLRVWSVTTRECILVQNLLDFTSVDPLETGAANACGHVVKVIEGSSPPKLCVYLSLQQSAQFVFLHPVKEKGRLKINHIKTLGRFPPDDLVDFVVTDSFLTTLWTTQAGETLILTTSLTQHGSSLSSEWQPVVLCQSGDCVAVPEARDAREVYLENIFSPGAFASQDIVKALSVFRRCPAPTVELESLYSVASLKEDVIRAIDTEIRNLSQEDELQEEDYTRLETEQWEKFYSCCHQYKQVGEKAKGLFADPITGLFGVIKKSTFSLLRPCDKSEELYLSPTSRISPSHIDRCGYGPEVVSAHQFSEDLRLLCDCVQIISAQLPSDVTSLVTFCLHTGHSDTALQEHIDYISSTLSQSDPDLIKSLTTKLSCMAVPVQAVEMLFSLLEVVDDVDLELMDSQDGGNFHHYHQLFSSHLGNNILTQSLQQLVSLRFQFVRELAVLLSIISTLKDKSGLTQRMHDSLTTELFPKSIYLLRCYQLLLWAGHAISAENANNTLDYNLRQLSSLEIIDGNVKRITKSNSGVSYLSELFIEGVGGEMCRQRLAEASQGTCSVWREDLAAFVNNLCQIIWPATDETVFPEFLVRSCQYLRLQEYVHILSQWCSWNESSRAFFLGLSHLHFDETHKAMNLFVEASDGLATETFMSQKLLQTEETDHYKLQILYYLKIIKLLEEKGLSDLVIIMATEAIHKAEENDENLPSLQSKVFINQLNLGHCEASFNAMMSNPDAERKKDCLRQFVAVLCDSGNLEELVSFDYQELESEVVHILKKRARSVDLASHDYYSLLYSYFIYREDFRAAGSVMLEKALRLSQEVPGLKSLQEQAQCYLAALNTLYLVRPENAWMVRPTVKSAKTKDRKRDSDGDPKPQAGGKLEIVELSDLKKEYLLLDARLRLIRHQPDTALVSDPMPSPEEILSLLCSAGLYDVAMSVIRMFDLSPDALLSSLSLRCVTLSLSVSTYSKITVKDLDPGPASWRWLKENTIPSCGASESSPSDQAWRLLQRYLALLEAGGAQCHRCVANTLLAQSFHLPTWLVNSYKALDVASLLRVHLNFDLIDQATSLAVEYLEAVTDVLRGIDAPAFHLKGLRFPTQMKVWVPYTCIDQLLMVLEEESHPKYTSMHKTLKDKLNSYQTKAFEIHQDIISGMQLAH